MGVLWEHKGTAPELQKEGNGGRPFLFSRSEQRVFLSALENYLAEEQEFDVSERRAIWSAPLELHREEWGLAPPRGHLGHQVGGRRGGGGRPREGGESVSSARRLFTVFNAASLFVCVNTDFLSQHTFISILTRKQAHWFQREGKGGREGGKR